MMQDTPLTPKHTVDSSDQLSKNQDSETSILKAFDTSMQSATPHQAAPHRTATPSGDHADSSASTMTNKTPLIAILSLVTIMAGVGTGYGAFKLQTKASGGSPLSGGGGEIKQVAEGAVKAGDVFGVNDANTFKDTAEGYLEIGGLDGEGSHKLLRPGGESQTVYLTSSITDLDKFDGMEVKVAGETFKGQKAGWLMDVGRVEVVNTQGTAPAEE